MPIRLPISLPKGIQLNDDEAAEILQPLDWFYIDGLAADFAALLSHHLIADAPYQPEDATRYDIVIVPLRSAMAPLERIRGGTSLGRRAYPGLCNADDEYDDDAYLVCVNGRCHPMMFLGPVVSGPVASYVEEKFGLGPASAAAVAVLLRAVNYHLNRDG